MNSKTNMKLKYVLSCLACFLLASHAAFAQTTIAKWTFETSQPGVVTLPAVPGAGVYLTNIVAEIGSGTASGLHFGGFGTTTYSSPAGNGSSHSFSSNGWTNDPGDFYQFAVSTIGYQSIAVSFDHVGSGTGPGRFYLAYSSDGVTFTQFGSIYNVTNVPSWSAATATALTSYSFDLSSITALTNAPVVYFRLVNATNTSASGATVASAGTSRVDNFAVFGTIPGVPSIVTQPQNTTNNFGDTATINILAAGTAPLSVQWYYPNLSTPLTDGSSGYGAGTISGSTNQTLTLTFVSTNQAGNYRVIVTNPLGSVTSLVAVLTVNVHPAIVTNIAYLHTLHNANFVLTDVTNIYQVEGIVTTPGNLVSPAPASSFFIQDSSGGMDVFFRGGFGLGFDGTVPSAGQHVRITGPLEQFNGLLEIHPVDGNPNHNIEVLDGGAAQSLPTPQNFDFTTLPSVTIMEESLEGRYLVVSNVFLAVTNASTRMEAGKPVFMTNLTGQVFNLLVPNTINIDSNGKFLPGPFATSVRGVMSQSTTIAIPTNGYSILICLVSDIEVGTPPSTALGPIPLNIQLIGTDAVLTWTNSSFFLQSSTNVQGTYNTIPGAASPYTNPAIGLQNYYRLVQTNQ
jgi:hypothetical protein